MNVLLIHLNPLIKSFQMGLAYIASTLQKDGHAIRFISLTDLEKSKIRNALRSDVDVVLVSVTSDSFELCKKTVAYIRRFSKVPLILGGIHPTICPDESVALEGVDGICIGEGEHAVTDLVRALECGTDTTTIPNLWMKKDGVVYRNGVRPLIDPLDELPPPNYDMFIGHVNFRVLPVLLSRGCCFNCSYCCNHTLRKTFKGKGRYLRQHSIEYSMKVIHSLLEKFPNYHEIEFYDDTFTLNKQWLLQFLNELAPLKVRFICNSRFDTLDEDIVRALADAGCAKINMAVESGNAQIRKEVLGRDMSNEEIVAKSALLRKYGIDLFTHNMVGMPYETEEKIMDTVNLNRRIKPQTTVVSIFNPYPKTRLAQVCAENGWIDERLKTSSYFDFTVLKTPFISPHTVNYYFLLFPHLIYDRGVRLAFKKLIFWVLHLRRNFLYRLCRDLLLKRTSPRVYNGVRRMIGNI